MSSTARSYKRRVFWPIKANDKRFVCFAYTESFVWLSVVDVDIVVVRADCQLRTIRRISHNFDPLLRIGNRCNFLVKRIDALSNVDFTCISSNCNMAICWVVSNSSCTLRIRKGWKSWSTSFNSLYFRRDLSYRHAFSLRCRPNHDFVVVAWSNDAVTTNKVKAPDFSIRMRLHQGLFWLWTYVYCLDCSVPCSNKKVASFKINSPDKTIKLNCLGLGQIGNRWNNDLSIFTSWNKFSFLES